MTRNYFCRPCPRVAMAGEKRARFNLPNTRGNAIVITFANDGERNKKTT